MPEDDVVLDDTTQDVPATEGQEDVQDIQAEVPADTTDSTATESPEQFDWTKFKNTERFVGRTPQEVIDHLNSLEHRYGRQSNELGEARSYREKYEALMRQIQGQKQPEQAPKKMTEYETAAFLQKLQEDPRAAISEFVAPQMAAQLKKEILDGVRQDIGPAVQQQAQTVAVQQEYAHLARNHPEIETDGELRWMTQRLMQPDYVGDRVPFEQAMFLAKMAKEEVHLFNVTCELMRSGMSFDRAKNFAELQHNSAGNADNKVQQIKDEVSGLKPRTGSRKQGTSEPEIKDMDDAFDV